MHYISNHRSEPIDVKILTVVKTVGNLIQTGMVEIKDAVRMNFK